MRGFIEFIKWCFAGDPPCGHHVNYTEKFWVESDGTPMHRFRCDDCGFREMGHFYGEAEERTRVVRNGKEAA